MTGMENARRLGLIVLLGTIGGFVGATEFARPDAACPAASASAVGGDSPRPAVWPLASPEPIERERDVWAQVVAISGRTLSPVLRPGELPPGLETVQLVWAEPNAFSVDYIGPGRSVSIAAGNSAIIPAYFSGRAAEQSVTVRAREGQLVIVDAEKPSGLVWLWWQEPGRLVPTRSATPAPELAQDVVNYRVETFGFGSDATRRLAEGLRPADACGELDSPS